MVTANRNAKNCMTIPTTVPAVLRVGRQTQDAQLERVVRLVVNQKVETSWHRKVMPSKQHVEQRRWYPLGFKSNVVAIEFNRPRSAQAQQDLDRPSLDQVTVDRGSHLIARPQSHRIAS